MKIVDIRDEVVGNQSSFRNAYVDFSQMTVSVVAVVTDVIRDGRPVVGYGFNSTGRYGCQGLLRERFIPRVLAAEPDELLDESGSNFDPAKVWATMMTNEKPGGHGERPAAVGVIDFAMWDAVAKIYGAPLWRLLADRYHGGMASERVWVYAAGGYYYPDDGLSKLSDEMRSYLDRGYRAVKLKIGAGLDEDLRRIETVIKVVGSGANVAVDANGRMDPETAIAYGEALRPYGLLWFEEPGDPLDFEMLAELAKLYDGPLATGENLFSRHDARNLLRYGGLRPDRDILQVDPVQSYGLVEYLRILEMLDAAGWHSERIVPHGGHQMALNVAAGLGLAGAESYPDVFRPFGGFADDSPIEDGYVRLPDRPGIGFEAKSDLYAVMRKLGAE
jgi:L-alanine-DL-glutamate epimerase-like enolase superfamily enzyme